jgi:tRNA1Val (adenine37-N6)-methyltransferase
VRRFKQIISKNSPSDRLFCYYHAGLDEFVEEPEDEYDLIVPTLLYTEDYKTDNEQRDLARFQDAMPLKI